MPTPITNRFSSFEFTNKELYTATRFSDLQLMLFQTLAANAAMQKVNLQYDPTSPLEFAQREAELTAEIAAYEHLLLLHTDTPAPEAGEQDEKADVKLATQPASQTQT